MFVGTDDPQRAPHGKSLGSSTSDRVTDTDQQQHGKQQTGDAKRDIGRTPTECGDRQSQGRLAGEATRRAQHLRPAAKHRKPRRKPARRHVQCANETKSRTGADQEATEIGGCKRLAKRENDGADAGHRAGPGDKITQTKTIDEQANGDLKPRINVKIDRRQVPEDRRANGKFPHQIIDHYRRRHPENEGIEEKHRAEQPPGSGKPDVRN